MAARAVALPVAQGIACHTADDGAHHGARARGAGAAVDLGICAKLLGNADLLDDGHGRQHAGAFLGHGAAAGQAGRRCADEPMCECHNLLLAIPVTGGGALPAV